MRLFRLSLMIVAALVSPLAAAPPAFAGWYDNDDEAVQTLPLHYSRLPNGDIEVGQRQYYWDDQCSTWRSVTSDAEANLGTEGGFRHGHLHWVPCNNFPKTRATPRAGTLPAAQRPSPFYIEFAGGGAFPGAAQFDDGTEDLNLGGTFHFGAGISTAIRGVSIQLDVDHASQSFSTTPSAAISGTSLMAVAKYTQPLGGGFSLYGGVGLGGVFVSEDYPGGGTGVGPGFEGVAGMSLDLSGLPNMSANAPTLFAQYSYQNTFGPVTASNGFPVQVGTGRAEVGLDWPIPELGKGALAFGW